VTVLVINQVSPHSRLFGEITAVDRHTLLGDTFTHAIGTTHPGRWIGQLATVTLLLFIVDAAATLWKQGGRRRAALIGGAAGMSAALAVGHSALVSSGLIHAPYMVSVFFLILLGAMAFELVDEALRAERSASSWLSKRRSWRSRKHVFGWLPNPPRSACGPGRPAIPRSG
jgi:hypothetical protein